MRTATGIPKTGLVAFLLTDVEGSVQRWEAHPDRMGIALARHEELLRTEIGRRGGYVFKLTGDGLFAAFHAPSVAIEVAVAAQHALARADFSDVGGMPVRMAVYAGYVEAEDGDYYGLGINRAARLLAIAYGEQILIGAAAAAMSQGFLPPGIELRELGRHRLRDVPDGEFLYQAVSLKLRSSFPPLRSGQATAHNLPGQLGLYIERPACATAINERLPQHRIVTLVGPGGVGKTRLAVETGFAQLDDGLEEIWYVELAALTDPQLVVEALCCTLGVDIPPDGSGTHVAVSYLKTKSVLLILDNCEHVIEACSLLVSRLLRACPRLIVLATSREPLGIEGECIVRVPGLAVPNADRGPGAASRAAWALGHESVRLFADRAAAAAQGFAVTDDNADAVCSICRQLDGIPMAIELVAPQLRSMRVEKLAGRLPGRLLSMQGRRTGVARHQTLQALFEWSYNLLRPDERSLFRQLSVFAGSWSLEAAEELAAGGPGDGEEIDRERVFDLLTSLVEKSLASIGMAGAETRYEYLQPVRQFAAQRLREGEASKVRRRLARYVLGRFVTASGDWPTTSTEDWLAAFEPELENLRVALDWAFGIDGDEELAVELTGHSARIWDELSLFAERKRYAAMAVARAAPDLPLGTRARLNLAVLSDSAHGDETNRNHALRAAALFRQAGDPLGEGEALARAGAAVLTPDTTGEATPLLEKALALLEPFGQTKPIAACLRSLSVSRYLAEDFDGAGELLERSEAVARAVGDDQGIAAAQIAAAELAFASRRPEDAVAITEALLEQGLCNRRQRVLGLGNLAAYRLALDRTIGAADAALTSLTEAKALDWPAAVTRAVEHLALVLALRGEMVPAARLLGFGDGFYAGRTASRERTEIATADRLRSLLTSKLDPAVLEGALALGAAWDHARAAEEAAKAVGQV